MRLFMIPYDTFILRVGHLLLCGPLDSEVQTSKARDTDHGSKGHSVSIIFYVYGLFLLSVDTSNTPLVSHGGV